VTDCELNLPRFARWIDWLLVDCTPRFRYLAYWCVLLLPLLLLPSSSTGGKIKITTTAVPMDGLKELAKRLAYDRVRATQLVALRQAAKKKKK